MRQEGRQPTRDRPSHRASTQRLITQGNNKTYRQAGGQAEPALQTQFNLFLAMLLLYFPLRTRCAQKSLPRLVPGTASPGSY